MFRLPRSTTNSVPAASAEPSEPQKVSETLDRATEVRPQLERTFPNQQAVSEPLPAAPERTVAAAAPVRHSDHGSQQTLALASEAAVLDPSAFWQAVGDIPRESHELLGASVTPPRRQTDTGAVYKRLGDLLIEAKVITQSDLDEALATQQETFEPLGELLVRAGKIGADALRPVLDGQRSARTIGNVLRSLGLRVNHVRSALMRIEDREEPLQQVMRDTGYLSEEMVALAHAILNGMQYFPKERMHRCKFAEMIEKGLTLPKYEGFAPVAILDERTLCVALEHVDHRNDAHNHFNQWENKRYVIASGSTLQQIFCTHFSRTEEELLNELRQCEKLIKAGNEDTDQGYVRRLVGMILRHACYSGASDIHMKESPCVATMSLRIDGVLKDVAFYDRTLHKRVWQLLKTDNAGINDGVKSGGINSMQEGAINFDKDKEAQQRFKDVFDRYGFRVQFGTTLEDSRRTLVIRKLDKQGTSSSVRELGFDERTLEIIERNIHAPDGLVICVGPTGSGKTTTLYAAIEEIDAEENSVQTIENPIEAEHGKWMSFQVTKREKLSEGEEMGAIFKGLLRNDPDAILVGEIRDSQVADTAIQAAKTGHIVFSTLHVTSAAGTITRLLGLDVTPQDIADTLRLVIAQRLVRRLCSNCALPDDRPSTLRKLEKPLKGYLAKITQPKVMRACDGGCVECRYTGYRGRALVYEVIEVDNKLREKIEKGAPTSEIEAHAIQEGASMFEVGLRYVVSGMTSMDELIRCVRDGNLG